MRFVILGSDMVLGFCFVFSLQVDVFDIQICSEITSLLKICFNQSLDVFFSFVRVCLMSFSGL